MRHPQPGILAPIPAAARYLTWSLRPGADPREALRRLAGLVDGDETVAGLGLSLVHALGAQVEGLRRFPAIHGPAVDIPATPAALWLWLRGEERGELLHRGRALAAALGDAFEVVLVVDAFLHDGGRDLTGFEDGTENPKDEAAEAAALVPASGGVLAGSSYVAVQQWVHDFRAFDAKLPQDQDLAIGRHRISNEEIEDAPASAHVKRTAQEDFEPEAFVLRRSMPWVEGQQAGLMFVAFGKSFDAFEAQLRRMSGVEDGIVDALFSFTRPLTGAYFWCPPVVDGRLDLAVLGL